LKKTNTNYAGLSSTAGITSHALEIESLRYMMLVFFAVRRFRFRYSTKPSPTPLATTVAKFMLAKEYFRAVRVGGGRGNRGLTQDDNETNLQMFT